MRSSQIDFEEVRKASICTDMKQGYLDKLDSCCMLLPMYRPLGCWGTESCCICVQGDHSTCNNLKIIGNFHERNGLIEKVYYKCKDFSDKNDIVNRH